MKTRNIKEIMTKNVVCITPDQFLIDVKHIYEKKDFHHHIPVVENNKLVGMVSLVDFMYHISGAGLSDNHEVYKTLKVKDIMSPNPYSVNTKATIKDVASVLKEGRFRAIPVLEDNKVVGIVSTADIIQHFLEMAESE
ncbi:CBS domain-containing protein [Winogradskyella alexanderae]|uniref:CBS domain-containing protein n=1 Tax=Winogradskyella alexanderae TaxID=2877123 RepID=A0ABS7XP94_9FLAO|nr:CBS domain-containing protein [Winogradskyella alexanderae]MCA0131833.1 CBS domain-containing protein [Winogradskyella alexanderae]